MKSQKKQPSYINLGCGSIFVDSPSWLNLDFSPTSSAVRKTDLLKNLPLLNEQSAFVYTSHFLEHVPRALVSGILSECLRVLKPGGLLRVVVPDLENMAREYLAMRDKGEHDKANFVVFEMIDQCVRQESGGELGKLYSKISSGVMLNNQQMMQYIQMRTGEDFIHTRLSDKNYSLQKLQNIMSAVKNRFKRYWINFCVFFLPNAFKSQNISFSSVGERHQWIWDFHQLKTELESVGFAEVTLLTVNTSAMTDFPYYPLDIDIQGKPRKGDESMYVEARKPIRNNSN